LGTEPHGTELEFIPRFYPLQSRGQGRTVPNECKSFANASIIISGIELAHRIHKRQFCFGHGPQWRDWSLKRRWDRALA
jgi:hypothetical protein